ETVHREGESMLAKLLALLLQSKGAAISAVFVLGTTGALVSATTQNGVTTVTITPATESASSSPADASKETDNDKDEHSSTSKTDNQNTGSDKDENDDKDSTTTTTTTTTGVTFTGTTPQAIADEATAAMTLTFNTAKATISALPTVTSKDAQTRATDQKSTAKK